MMAKKKKRKKKLKMIEPVEPPKPAKVTKKKRSNYIDNQKMFVEMCEYIDKVKIYNEVLKKLKLSETKPLKPKVSEYIGECIMLIAQRLATKPNFANYTHREEMIGDGIENCLTYIDNFDPTKSSNPFAYFTQIIYYAFIRRIQREKKQVFVKMKLVERMDNKGHVRKLIQDENVGIDRESKSHNLYADFFNLNDTDITFFEKKAQQKKLDKKNKKSRRSNLDEYFL